jgi:hypothetical protein
LSSRCSTPCLLSMSSSKPQSLHSEDGGIKVLLNVGILPHHYMASQLESSSPWKLQISKEEKQTVQILSSLSWTVTGRPPPLSAEFSDAFHYSAQMWIPFRGHSVPGPENTGCSSCCLSKFCPHFRYPNLPFVQMCHRIWGTKKPSHEAIGRAFRATFDEPNKFLFLLIEAKIEAIWLKSFHLNP